jgi:hypothetical protein
LRADKVGAILGKISEYRFGKGAAIMASLTGCVFCNPNLDPKQQIVLENEYCMFLQYEDAKVKGSLLEGSGLKSTLIKNIRRRATILVGIAGKSEVSIYSMPIST